MPLALLFLGIFAWERHGQSEPIHRNPIVEKLGSTRFLGQVGPKRTERLVGLEAARTLRKAVAKTEGGCPPGHTTAGRVSRRSILDNAQQGKVEYQGGERNPLAQSRRPLKPMRLFRPARYLS